MADTERRRTGPRLGDCAVELRVAAQLENVALVRTLVGAVGAFEDLDIDRIADLRLAVDEACTQLINSAPTGATLVVVVDPREKELIIHASAACRADAAVQPGSFSWHVLTALTDDVTTFRDDGRSEQGHGTFGVTLTTWRAGAAQ